MNEDKTHQKSRKQRVIMILLCELERRTLPRSACRYRGLSGMYKENEKFLRQNRMTFVFGGARKALTRIFHEEYIFVTKVYM